MKFQQDNFKHYGDAKIVLFCFYVAFMYPNMRLKSTAQRLLLTFATSD